jgi:superfamily II RNA helicase
MAPDQLRIALEDARRKKPVSFMQLFKKKYEISQQSDLLSKLFDVLLGSPCFDCASKSSHIPGVIKLATNRQVYERLKKESSSGEAGWVTLIGQYMSVLKNLGYVKNDVITLKGRVAIECQSNAHELICAELIMSNFFDGCAPEDVAALTSCLVAERVGNKIEEPVIEERLWPKIDAMEDIGGLILDELVACGVTVDEETFIKEKVNPALISGTLAWAQGASFAQALQLAEGIPEGNMVRVLVQTCGLLSCFGKAAALIGNKTLGDVFSAAEASMKRGIVFSASLYLD